MNVARLEQWCDEQEAPFHPTPEAAPDEVEQLFRTTAVYRRMIAEYRELVELLGEFDSDYTRGGIATLGGAIADLTRALVPKEE